MGANLNIYFFILNTLHKKTLNYNKLNTLLIE